MTSSLFTIDGDVFTATDLATGPWAPDALHGGPVAALLSYLLEREPGAERMFPARLTVELLRPVGHRPMRAEVEVVRPGKKVRVVGATLFEPAPDGSRVTVARATLQQIRSQPVALPPDHRSVDPEEQEETVPEDAPSNPAHFFVDEAPAFHNRAVEHRSTNAFFGQLGPAFDWIRVTVDLLPGVPPSPLARVAAAADFGNGISAALPVGEYMFVNPDLTVVLSRLPGDEWVGLDARTRIDGDGVGYAESALYDRHGRIGRSIQSLLIDRLSTS
jgi:hypothetical protein